MLTLPPSLPDFNPVVRFFGAPATLSTNPIWKAVSVIFSILAGIPTLGIIHLLAHHHIKKKQLNILLRPSRRQIMLPRAHFHDLLPILLAEVTFLTSHWSIVYQKLQHHSLMMFCAPFTPLVAGVC